MEKNIRCEVGGEGQGGKFAGHNTMWKEIVDSVSEVSESFTYSQFNALHNIEMMMFSMFSACGCSQITEAKYKNNKIQKYNYDMFCGWSELTQV